MSGGRVSLCLLLPLLAWTTDRMLPWAKQSF